MFRTTLFKGLGNLLDGLLPTLDLRFHGCIVLSQELNNLIQVGREPLPKQPRTIETFEAEDQGQPLAPSLLHESRLGY